MLKVGVTDNGIGMTPEEMAANLVRVFFSVDICASKRASKKGNPRQIWNCRISCAG